MNLPSNKIIKDDINAIDFQGVEIFKKNENLFDSEIVGIPLKWIVAIAGIIWFFKNKVK